MRIPVRNLFDLVPVAGRAGRKVLLATAVVCAGFAAAPAGLCAQQPSPGEIHRLVEEARPSAFDLYRDLLSLPNDARRPDDIGRLVSWLESAFRERGFETERLPTAGNPLLLAERRAPSADRTALVYLQADGQPVDTAAWAQESPWKPVLKEPTPDGGWRRIPWDRVTGQIDQDWRVFARSASDSKGPIAQFLMAVTLLESAGIQPDVHLKVILDTEEELGSPHLPAAVERFRDRLSADMLVIFDGPPHDSGQPTLVFGARGIATATLTTYGPKSPQHSGHYGNWIPNPAFRLADLLAGMKDDAGRVLIPGWYDGISISEETRRILRAVPDEQEALRRRLGFAAPESVAPTRQEAIQYPSLNVRGMRAAWVGDQARTVIPDSATAEIDIRLVPASDPDRLLSLLGDYVRDEGFHVLERAPTDAERLEHDRIATLETSVFYGAFRTPFDSEPGRWLTRAIARYRGEEPVRIASYGGSIPIAHFVRTLGVPAVVVPTVNRDNNQHSPNENLRIGDFLEGIGTIAAVLSEPLPDP